MDITDAKGAMCRKPAILMGAQVIKVDPIKGDEIRDIPPFY